MNGFIIEYKAKDANARTLLNHTLFGRLIITKKGYAYYTKGILHDIKFARLVNSRVFVENIEGIDLDTIKIFGDVIVTPSSKSETSILLKTGKQHWLDIAAEKNIIIRGRKIK